MPDWRPIIAQIAYDVDTHFENLKLRLKQRMGWLGPVQILAYRGHGTSRNFFIKGRVLEDKGITEASDNDTVWENILAMYKRFQSVEIPGVRVRARFLNAEKEALTDEEGYFDIAFELQEAPPANRLWHQVDLQLLDEVVESQGPVHATEQVLVPPQECDFGVISDVDDTVIETHATSLFKMAKITFLNNARTRLPFKGVAAFYRALHRGSDNTPSNPIFYVSRTLWNLYDLLDDFMDIHGIPAGPLLLRKLSSSRERPETFVSGWYKLRQIERILSLYPELPFILIGDSGQRDPEIYRQVVHKFPGRILAIYIRNVSSEVREEQVYSFAEQLRADKVEMLLVEDSEAAARHAADRGFITPESLLDVTSEKIKDTSAPSDLELLIDEV